MTCLAIILILLLALRLEHQVRAVSHWPWFLDVELALAAASGWRTNAACVWLLAIGRDGEAEAMNEANEAVDALLDIPGRRGPRRHWPAASKLRAFRKRIATRDAKLARAARLSSRIISQGAN